MSLPARRLLLTFLTGLLVGASYVIGKLAMAHGVSPVAMSLVQIGGAALVLLALLRGDGTRLPRDPRTLRFFAMAAAIAVVGSTLLGNWVLARIPAGVFTLLVTLSPLFTSMLSAAVARRRPAARALLGTALGLLGVALVLAPRAQGVDREQTLALLLALAVPLLLASGNVYRARHWPHGVSAIAVSAGILGVQALLLVPVTLATERADSLPPLAANAPLLALLVAVTVAGNVAGAALQRIADSVAYSQIGYVIALTGVGAGALLFGERLGLAFVPALALVFTGVVLVNRRPSTPSASLPQTASAALPGAPR
ncbi:MAG TPA: DMT family transporter [Lysobacter sp.]|nr:DMT family transporter [Lysobacter sp.]